MEFSIKGNMHHIYDVSLKDAFFYYRFGRWNFYFLKRGCCIRSPLVTKLLHTVLFHEDITQLEQKKSNPWYTCDWSLHRVSSISAHYFWRYEHFTERHFHFCGLILLLVTEISEQPRYIFANISGEYFSKPIFALKHWAQAGRFEYHEPYNRKNYY